MLSKDTKLVDKVVLVLNLIVYRVDALLTNFIDGYFVLIYTFIVNTFTGYNMNLSCGLLHALYVPILIHVSYTIVYIVNDTIDYAKNRNLKAHLHQSFYELRPIYRFKGSKKIVFLMFSLYVVMITLLIMYIPNLFNQLVVFVCLMVPTAIIHSIYRGKARILTFFLLRFLKYFYTITIFYMITFDEIHVETLSTVFLSLVLPYTTYLTINYALHLQTNFRNAILLCLPICGLLTILLSVIGLLELPFSGQILYSVVKSSFIAYLFVVAPALTIRYITRKLLGPYNPNFYHHLMRLVISTVMLLIIESLALLMYCHTFLCD